MAAPVAAQPVVVAAQAAAAPAAPVRTWSDSYNAYVDLLPSCIAGLLKLGAEDGFFTTVAKVIAAFSSIPLLAIAAVQKAWHWATSFCTSAPVAAPVAQGPPAAPVANAAAPEARVPAAPVAQAPAAPEAQAPAAPVAQAPAAPEAQVPAAPVAQAPAAPDAQAPAA